ncbi:dynein regulatory complex protein 1-like isoform X2 [Corticium candelabrum]|uniref:dynein regulatory complex protein 1-like isoform X2 n=1 Tax=Corticium candelabrum TaxID=121492 RepID=UPI002E276C14|nr:dynein regulatory complex protein 1-like isoform X2 [Corticium candelabrum]
MLYQESEQGHEQQGPSVDSDIPEERIKARRLRIQARIEASKREASGEKEVKPRVLSESDRNALRKSSKQIDQSLQRVNRTKAQGILLATNVISASDARESHRRLEDDDAKKARMEKLTAETKASEEKFEEITKKWENVQPMAQAQELHEMLMAQKAACDAMIDEKNKLIMELQQELKSKDEQYVNDLKQQTDDVDIMIERMEDQIKNISQSYKDELQQIEISFESERQELVESHRQKWEANMQRRREKEEEYMKARQVRVDEFEAQLQHLRTQDAEEYNKVKIKMETDVQTLEQQLQSMKATFQLNAEKLDYNFQVLKKRDEENTITKSQQKRKITRLQDTLNNLRSRLAKQDKTYREENSSLSEDYRRLSGQFKKLQEKSKHFQLTDMKRFMDIWEMNEWQAVELRQKVLEADRIAHEQQLGLKWEAPEQLESPIIQTANVEGDGGEGKDGGAVEARMSASDTAAKVFSAEIDAEGDRHSEHPDNKSSTPPFIHLPPAAAAALETSHFSSTAVKRALELICDESGFLVEEKLTHLLAPLDKNEQSLMKLDSIFKALGVETEEDVHLLVSYFLKAAEEGETDEIITQGSETQIEGFDDDQFERSSSVHLALGRRIDLIHLNDALKALKQFSEDHAHTMRAQSKKQTIKSKPQITAPSHRETSLDPVYWQRISAVITPEKEQMWDGLLVGLERYSKELQERSSLIQDTESLSRQNVELRMLLNQYLMSKINLELEIPPTKTLPLEVGKSRSEYP